MERICDVAWKFQGMLARFMGWPTALLVKLMALGW